MKVEIKTDDAMQQCLKFPVKNRATEMNSDRN